ncbi:MAG: D-aminoacyl-tRNA deacylase [Halobacteria archaeon]|nr:D-aminoacyl-tRNA deacylase [Halobacteria archaeon]
MIGIVVSRDDEASLNIRDRLLEEADWEETEPEGDWEREYRRDGYVMVEKEGLHLYYDDVDSRLSETHDTDLLVFASRHSGDTGELLTAHFTGNFGEAEYGGEEGGLAKPAPHAAKSLLRFFEDESPDGFDVSFEATHHGPTAVETPSLYAEIGSGEDEWEREDAARTVARGLLGLDTSETYPKVAVGLGGGHYAPKFTRILLETDVAFGHVVPDHCLDDLDDTLIDDVFEISAAGFGVLDGDGTEEDLRGYPSRAESVLRRRSGLEDEVAEAIESAMSGERLFLTAHKDEDEDEEVDEVDHEDVDVDEEVDEVDPAVYGGTEAAREARRTDPDGFEDLIEEHCLGYSENDDSSLADVVLETDETEDFTRGIAGILRDKYDDVVYDEAEGEITVRRQVFSPGKAKEMGVPEGRLFGKLSGGEEVELDDRTICPEDVHVTETKVFEV